MNSPKVLPQSAREVNGEVVNILENVPTNRYAKLIVLGGDVFQPSFVGNVCELVIYNETKDYDFIQEMYESYIHHEKFIAIQNNDDSINHV